MIPPGLALAAQWQGAGPGSGAEAAPSLPSEADSWPLPSSWSLVVLVALSPGVTPQGWPLGFLLRPHSQLQTQPVILRLTQPRTPGSPWASDVVQDEKGTRLHPRVPPFLIHRVKGCAERGLPGPSCVGPRLSLWTSVPSSCFPTLTKPLGPGLLGEASTPPGHCPSHRPS